MFGFEEFPQILVDYLDCCIEQDSEDDKEFVAAYCSFCCSVIHIDCSDWLLAYPLIYIL